MPSSSLSVLVFEKQKLRYLLQSPAIHRGLGFAEGHRALGLRSPAKRLSYRWTAKSMATGHNQITISIAVTKLQQLRDSSAMLLACHRLSVADSLEPSIISSSHWVAARS